MSEGKGPRGLVIKNARNGTMTNVRIEGFQTGLEADNLDNVHFDKLTINTGSKKRAKKAD